MRIRKAILTGGGRATRLHPITALLNKHLLPLGNKPMIFHAIEKVVEAGVDQIFINVNPGETELQKHVGDGGHWNVNITFFEQTGGPQGIAHVVKEAEKFIGDDPFIFYLSDNIFTGSLKDIVDEFEKTGSDCLLTLSKVPDPERFGVPVYDSAGNLVDVEEKPSSPKNNFAVTGIYIYGPKVFFDAYKHIEKSSRGEYEISSIHSHFLKQKHKVTSKEITGWWKDTGKVDDLLFANRLLLDGMHKSHFPLQGVVEPGAVVEGKVTVGSGSIIKKGAIVRGPVMIGENCVLSDCEIGPHVTIGSGTSIRQARISDSILLENSSIDAPARLYMSIVGKQVTIRQAENNSVGGQMIVSDKSVIEL